MDGGELIKLIIEFIKKRWYRKSTLLILILFVVVIVFCIAIIFSYKSSSSRAWGNWNWRPSIVCGCYDLVLSQPPSESIK